MTMTIGRLYKLLLLVASPFAFLFLLGLWGQVLKGDWGGFEFLPLIVIAMCFYLLKKLIRLLK